MRVVTRIRAYAGLWLLTAVLGAMMVLVAAAAGPVTRGIEDHALGQTIASAPQRDRDLTVIEPLEASITTAGQMREDVTALLPQVLADVVEESWGIQRTQIRRPSGNFGGFSASLAGEGVNLEPSTAMPLASLLHQTDLLDEVTVTDGVAPASQRTDRTADTVIEVMASEQVAESLGLRVGQVYQLFAGVAARASITVEEAPAPPVAVELTGVFEPHDPAAPVWEFDPQLLTAGTIWWVFPDGSITPLTQATLVTDQAGIDAIMDTGMISTNTSLMTTLPSFAPENIARIRLDADRLEAAQVTELREAIAALAGDPGLRPQMELATRLIELIDQYQRAAAAARALIAVVVAGLIGIGLGLLVLAARLTLARRRAEVSLLRARGASVPGVVARFLAEAAVVVLPAVALGWLLHLVLVRGRDVGLEMVPLAVAGVALLAVPVTLAVDLRHHPGYGGGRSELRRYRSAPARVTVELLAVVLAGLGLLLLHRRGLNLVDGTDPYLSAVPLLVAVAAGILALRMYAPPLRAFGAMTARRRGAVGFLALARAGRAAPVSALPLLLLVLAVAVGGFAGAVYASVAAARDAAAVEAVGADARLIRADLTDESMAAVAAVPGVTTVAAVRHNGLVWVGDRVIQGVYVVTVDADAYQRILASVGAPVRLPEAIVSARPGADLVPILADRQIAERASGLTAAESVTVEIDHIQYPAELVGDIAGLPDLVEGERWVLVPRQALPEPTPIDELLIGGSAVDAGALSDALGGESASVEVTTLAERRAELEGFGFNQGLTIVFVVGTLGAAVGGVLAIGLALVVQAAARSHSLSLLRTMGLSSRQARGLLLIELTPATLLAVLAGAATGIALPVLLAPALGLTEFTGGVPIEVGLDPRTVALFAGLLAVFVLGGALIEAAVNRRLGLGQVLRVD